VNAWLAVHAVLTALVAGAGAGGCHAGEEPSMPDDSFPELHGPYLGQTPPGLTAERFGPAELKANAAWHWHGSPAFSRSGLEMYFVEYQHAGDNMEIWFTDGTSGTWTAPELAAFAQGMEANQPTFLDNDQGLLFAANQSLYRVHRTASGWSSPTRVPVPLSGSQTMGWEFSLAADGTLYVLLWESGGPAIHRSSLVGGAYQAPVGVEEGPNTSAVILSPLVAPDERWLMYSAILPGGYGAHDLWIRFRNEDGKWSDPVNMGPEINSPGEEVTPRLSPDGRYLFFGAQREGDLGDNPYWVSAAVIDSVRVRTGG